MRLTTVKSKTAQTYGLTIKGEQHTYLVESWGELDAETLCAILSDLTGWRVDYLRRELPGMFDRLGYATVRPAGLGAFGETPVFRVRSSAGLPMPALS